MNGVTKVRGALTAFALAALLALGGDEDGPWDREAWQAGAFYGNPLGGFTPGS